MTAKASPTSGVRAKVKRLRDKSKLSFGEIGTLIGVTRQRAHQLYTDAKNGTRPKKNK